MRTIDTRAFAGRRVGLVAGAALCSALAVSAAQAQDGGISAQVGPDPQLPAPSYPLLPDLKVATVVGWQDGEAPAVPDGLKITRYAGDLVNPRTVHTLPNGDVLVVQGKPPEGKPLSRPKDVIRGFIMSLARGGSATTKPSNLVTLLRDTDRDGTVDERHDLLTGLHSPFGIAWHDGTLYVAAADAILAYPYQLGATSITAEAKVLTPLPGGPINHHWTKDLALSPDGRFLYASVGSNSNVGENGLEAEKGRAAIWQVDRRTGASRLFASGLRNPNGLTFHPDTGVLWTVVNERDELGPDLVPDYMTSVREGGFYGWPWSYFGDNVDIRVHPPRPDLVENAIEPDYALGSHVAALGMAFSMESALPEPYRAGAFVGQHGSWNRNVFSGYKVVYVPFAEGKPTGPPVDVVTGFLDGDRARGRPVGVAIDGTGALLVADDSGNSVWRVAAADGTISPGPVPTDQVVTPANATATTTERALPADTPEARDSAPAPSAGDMPSLPEGERSSQPAPEPSGPRPTTN